MNNFIVLVKYTRGACCSSCEFKRENRLIVLLLRGKRYDRRLCRFTSVLHGRKPNNLWNQSAASLAQQ